MKRSIFNILHVITLKPLFFEKNKIKTKNCQNPLRVQFIIGEPSVFYQTAHIYVFWGADYEYGYENTRKFDFWGQNQNKKKVFHKFFHFMSININLGKKYFLLKL